MSNVTEVIDYYESGKKLSDGEITILIQNIYHLRNKIEELNEEIEELNRELNEESEEKYDPKVCTMCNFRSKQVLINGGRCNSCM